MCTNHGSKSRQFFTLRCEIPVYLRAKEESILSDYLVERDRRFLSSNDSSSSTFTAAIVCSCAIFNINECLIWCYVFCSTRCQFASYDQTTYFSIFISHCSSCLSLLYGFTPILAAGVWQADWSKLVSQASSYLAFPQAPATAQHRGQGCAWLVMTSLSSIHSGPSRFVELWINTHGHNTRGKRTRLEGRRGHNVSIMWIHFRLLALQDCMNYWPYFTAEVSFVCLNPWRNRDRSSSLPLTGQVYHVPTFFP